MLNIMESTTHHCQSICLSVSRWSVSRWLDTPSYFFTALL